MLVSIKGQFLENGSYHSNKTNTDVSTCTLLVGATAIQINGVQIPDASRLDDIEMSVDLRAYGSNLLASYVPGTPINRA